MSTVHFELEIEKSLFSRMTAVLEKRKEKRSSVLAQLIHLYVITDGTVLSFASEPVPRSGNERKGSPHADPKSMRESGRRELFNNPYLDCWYEIKSNKAIRLRLDESEKIHRYRLDTFGFSFRDGVLVTTSQGKITQPTATDLILNEYSRSEPKSTLEDNMRHNTGLRHMGNRVHFLSLNPEVDCCRNDEVNRQLSPGVDDLVHHYRLDRYGFSVWGGRKWFKGKQGGYYYLSPGGHRIY